MDGTCPMNAGVWRRFLDDRLSAAERDNLLAHLEADCPDCEKFFLEDSRQCTVDSIGVPEILLRECEPDGKEREEIFEKIISGARNMGTRNKYMSPYFFSSRRWKGLSSKFVPAALALMAAVAIIFHYSDRSGYDGIKGPDLESPSIILQVAVLKGNGSSVPERGIPQETYRPQDTLIFRYELGAHGYVYLLRAEGQDYGLKSVIHVLEPAGGSLPVAQERGVWEFREEGQALGYPLKGLQGTQVFIAVASKRPMDAHRELAPLVRRYLKGEIRQKSPDWAIDAFQIVVETRRPK